MDMINWSAHGKSMRKQINTSHWIHITKMILKCLSSLQHLYQRDNGRQLCPGCHWNLQEDRNHIIRGCKADSRESWQAKFHASIEEFPAKVDTYRPFRHILREAIGECMKSEDDDLVIKANAFHLDVRAVINQQNDVGWREDNYYARERRKLGTRNDKHNVDRWQTQLISQIWTQWMQLWKARNKKLHGKQRSSCSELGKKKRGRTGTLSCLGQSKSLRIEGARATMQRYPGAVATVDLGNTKLVDGR